MSWVTPKINWTPPDGVRDTDLNRIEGNILELRKTAAVYGDITLHVTTDGNDTTGTGTSAAPYRTIQKALDTIPRNLNGHNVIIQIASGTYGENVTITGYSNGKIVLNGYYYDDTAVIRSLSVSSSICEVRTLELVCTAGGVSVSDGAALMCSGPVSVSGSSRGLHVTTGSVCRIYSMLTVNASFAAAVQVGGASRCYILHLAGSDNENAIIAEEGSVVGYGSTNISVNVAGYITRTGGRIYTGGQANMPSY